MKRTIGEDASRDVGTGLLVFLVLLNVGLQLISASMVKFTSGLPASQLLLGSTLLVAILALNLGRFAVWNLLHKRFPLSIAYPANALFFPCVVALAYFYGEPVSARQFLGAGLVAIGVVVLIAGSPPTQEIE